MSKHSDDLRAQDEWSGSMYLIEIECKIGLVSLRRNNERDVRGVYACARRRVARLDKKFEMRRVMHELNVGIGILLCRVL